MSEHHVRLIVNGHRVEASLESRVTLADLLRDELALRGTHVGCEEGACGACTVLLDGRPVRSCVVLAVSAAGQSVETVESLAPGDELHPLQRAFHECHGLQCGFCTPGMLMSAVALLRETPTPSPAAVREALAGNLCRCTGYDSIVRAVMRAAELATEEEHAI